MTDHTIYLSLALPVPLRRHFDYLPPAYLSVPELATLQPGVRIEVPFGRQTLVGILIAIRTETTQPVEKLKRANKILDDAPLLPTTLLNLVTWAARYYQHAEGDALLSILPALLREGAAATRATETVWRLTTHGKGLPVGALKRSTKQALALQHFQQGDLHQQELETIGISRAIVRELLKKKLIETFEREIAVTHTKPDPARLLASPSLPLNPEQRIAVEQISATTLFQTFLLQGVTGSGKTEVYLQVIEHTLKQQRQALVLVPEIGLTPQTVQRFQQRFHVPVVAFHSGLNHRERLDAWLQASRGEAAIVIGTRSAIFTPMPKLGVIIIDEEHDSSFKQQDGFHYHARDVAIVRAQRESIPVILGSATPSLESLHNAMQGRYAWLRLTERAGKSHAPHLHVINVQHEKLREGFSVQSLDTIQHTLAKGEQVLVFLNRRGYAPVLICADCSWMSTCPHCDTRLTVHKRIRQLRCHHCDLQQLLPQHCPHCHSPRLDYLGQGTQRSEELLAEMFHDVPVLRMDRDSVARKDSLGGLLQQIHHGQPCILVGTQMIAKGHHFPEVTLVVILDADSGLFSSDFRGAEKLAQLLTQVAGRAGRANRPGLVMIQSRYADHPLLQTLLHEGYEGLARRLLQERKTLQLPPYRQQAVLRCESTEPARAQEFLHNLRHWLQPQLSSLASVIQLVGPLPALMEKRANFYRYELVFSSSQRPLLQHWLSQLALHIEHHAESKKLRWSIDVDPV